jgi:hypothetical protein
MVLRNISECPLQYILCKKSIACTCTSLNVLYAEGCIQELDQSPVLPPSEGRMFIY